MDDRRTLGAELEATIEARKDLGPVHDAVAEQGTAEVLAARVGIVGVNGVLAWSRRPGRD